MQKFYDNPVRHGIRGLRGLGILALSVAFCLTGLLALSSCDLGFGDDNETDPETVEMRGFFTSVDENNETDCSDENLDVHITGDVADGIPNVRITSRGVDFEDASFSLIGIKVDGNDNNPETIATTYVSANDDGSFDRPAAYFLLAKPENSITEETIYTGYWTGYAYRPGGEGTLKPVVMCPYVLVPADTEDLEDIAEGECGTGNDPVHPKLRRYLEKEKDDGSSDLRACHILLNDGVLNPTPNPSSDSN